MQPDPKAMARALREQLHTRGLDLAHGTCLDIVARQLGHRDWNVLAAQARRPSLVRVSRTCEWRAVNDGHEMGRITAGRRPDGRWFVVCDTWYDAAHDALVTAVADDLHQELYATVDDGDAEALRRFGASAFVVHRREDEVTIGVAKALDALAGARVPSGYTVVRATAVDDSLLRRLDDALRADVPGCDGWVNDSQEFREYTFAPSHFDPSAYLVALDADGAAAGLVRIWTAPLPHRLELIGVLPAHRRVGLARALLAAALGAVHAQGVTVVVAEADIANVASQALLHRLGARRTGGSIELRRPA